MFFSPTGLQSNLSPRHIGFYPWENKPLASSVPDGTRITTMFGTSGVSDWHTRGGYWVPVNGRAVVYAPNTTGIQAQSSTMQPVAGIPGWTMPEDLTNVPGIFIEAQVVCSVSAASNLQARSVFVGITSLAYAIMAHQYTSVTTPKRVWGRAHRLGSGNWRPGGFNSNPVYDSNNTPDIPSAWMSASPIRLYYQGGAPSGSEILNVDSFSLSIGIG